MAKLGYKAKVVGAEELIKVFNKYPDIFRDEIKTFYETAGLDIASNAKAEAPVFMGALRASITHETTISGRQSFVKIAPSLSGIYPSVMEFGRRPGAKPPPPAALIRWVHLVIAPGESQEARVAYLISRSIGRKGIKGREYMRKGLDKSSSKFNGWLNDFLDRVLRRLDNGS